MRIDTRLSPSVCIFIGARREPGNEATHSQIVLCSGVWLYTRVSLLLQHCQVSGTRMVMALLYLNWWSFSMQEATQLIWRTPAGFTHAWLISGIAMPQTMPRHNMGIPCFCALLCEVQKQLRRFGGRASPENTLDPVCSEAICRWWHCWIRNTSD